MKLMYYTRRKCAQYEMVQYEKPAFDSLQSDSVQRESVRTWKILAAEGRDYLHGRCVHFQDEIL